MLQPIQILMVEDNAADAELLVRALRRGGFEPDWRRVETEADYVAALHAGLELVLSDYELPQFNGLRALEILRASGLEVPLVLVSGTIGEEMAVEAMRMGASDYLLKDRLARLGPAVAHALEQGWLRRQRREADQEKARAEAKYRSLFENSLDGLYQTTAEGRLLVANPALARLAGYDSPEEMVARVTDVGETFYVNLQDRERFKELMRVHGATYGFETQMRRKDGSQIWISAHARVVRDDQGGICYAGALQDITERKRAEQRMARLSRLYVVLSRVNELIVRTPEASPLFEGVCRIAVEHGQFRLAAIFALEATTGEVRPVAYFGAEVGYFLKMRVNLTDPNLNRGTIGTAIRTGRYDICNDIANDARMAAWQSSMTWRGFHSTASFPIRQGGEVFGALVLFSAETNLFQEDEIKLLTAVADDVSFALDAINGEGKRQRAEVALRESEVSMSTAQRIAQLGSWELELTGEEIDGNSLRWSDEMFRIAGFAPGAVRVTNELFFSLVPPEEHESIRRAVAAAVRERGQYAVVHRLIRPDGTTRIVREVAQVTCDGQTGRPVKLVGTAHDITALKQAETERDRLFNLSLDLLCVASFDGWFEQVNPAWTSCLGWTAEELTARPMSEFILPEDHETTARIRARVQQGEPIRGFENRYRAKDGSHRWLSWSVYPLVESRRVFAVARDVTARKQSQEALRASEERLQLVTDNARVGLMMIDRERRYTYANTTYAEMLGLAAGDLVGHRVGEVLPVLYETQIRERLDRAFAGERMAYELAWPTVGEPRHYLARYEPTKVDGAVALVVVVITDITTRKHAEEALRASAGAQRQLAEQLEREGARLVMAQAVAKVGSWETDLATRSVAWSAETFRIFEVSPENFQPTHAAFLERVHPADRAAVDLAFTRSLEQTGPFMIEHRLAFPGGRIKVVEERWVVFDGGQGGPRRAVGTCQDVTRRREVEDVIRTAAGQMRALAGRLQAVREEERTTLAREIHDVLAQELTRLKIDLVWLAKRLGRPVDESSPAAINRRIADAVAQTDTAITTVQRIATDLRPVILDSLGLPAAVEWQAEDFARRTGIVCRARASGGETALPREQATAIYRILQESLTNVARHSQASEVEVEFTELADTATLTVRDNGVGITPAQLADPRSIGLLGMRERALAFGGTVEISSSPGPGTTILVRLPIESTA